MTRIMKVDHRRLILSKEVPKEQPLQELQTKQEVASRFLLHHTIRKSHYQRLSLSTF